MRPVLSAVLVVCLAAAAHAQSPSHYDLQKLADGVYAAIPTKPPGLMVYANTVFVINDDGVLVVDPGVTPSAARELLGMLRTLTDKSVRYVVNTHWHDDHVVGNHVFRQAFPAAEFIAHAETRRYLPDRGVKARQSMFTDGAKFLEFLKGLLAKGENFAGEPMNASERTAYAADIRLAEQFFAEVPNAPIVLPTLAVEDGLTLDRGGREVRILRLGRGHTAGDIAVHLPKENILITGDLVVAPVPLIGSDQSHIADWAPALENLLALKPAILVPGHGPVMPDDSYVRTMLRLLTAIRERTAAAVARGETLEQVTKSVDLSDLRQGMAGDDRVLRTLFRMYVWNPGVAAAFREASSKP